MKKTLSQKILSAPHLPGVYLFRNSNNRIIYIGKAADLKKRLASYLAKDDNRKELLVSKSTGIDIIITNSDTEALTLEESLIKLRKPRFNVRLKDDKKFPFLKITIKEAYPRVLFTREITPDGSLIFGPYTNARALRQTRDALCRIFKLVSCTKDLTRKYKRPCLEFNLGRCSAPCAGMIEQKTYNIFVKKAVKFLRGHSNELEKEIEKTMWRYAQKEHFEGAAFLRNQLRAVRKISQRQQIVSNSMIARDIIGISKSKATCIACLFRIRESRMTAKEIFELKISAKIYDDEITSSFIRLIYTHISFIPEEIVIAPRPLDWNTQKKWFEERGFGVKISLGKRGETKRLLELAQRNAASELAKRSPQKRVHPTVSELQETLLLKNPPRWVEAFDISNLKEKFAVGASVAFYDGRPDKKRYRHYRIKRTSGQNDFAMIHEIVRRRIKDLQKKKRKPDLLLIDGGKGQLKAAINAIKSIDIDIPVFALAKRNDELFDCKGNVISLPIPSKGIMMLKRLRDEAHRFAITYHRNLRGKTVTRSVLDDIPGIGEKRKITLLSYFGSIRALQKISEEDLSKVPGIGKKFSKIIYESLHS